jgi:PST family polysaccharide transporter
MFHRLRRGDVGTALTNLIWLAAERLTQVLVVIIASGVLARYFGADVFGKWQYANVLLNVIAPLTWVCGAEILVPAMVAASASGTPGPALSAILGSAFVLRMTISASALLLVWATLFFGHVVFGQFDGTVAAMLAGLALTMLFREPFGIIGSWLQSRTYSKPALLLSLGAALVKALAVYLLARAALHPGGFGWIWAVESAAIALGLLLYYRQKNGGQLGWRVEPARVKHFASAGAVFWLGLICMYAFMKLDRLMLQHYVDFAELGRYAAAQQLNENWIALALLLAQTVAPAFIYRISDKAVLRRNLWRLLALTGAAMACGAVLLGFCAPLIVRIIFGSGFTATAEILRWAGWLSLPAGLEAICNLMVLKYQAKYVVLLKWMAALAAAFVANLLLIPAYGGYGALIGVAAGYLVALAVDGVYIRKVLFTPTPVDMA